MKITNRELLLENERDDAINAALKIRSELEHISSRNLQLLKELAKFRAEPIQYSPAKLNLLSKRNIELIDEIEALKKQQGHHLTGVQAYEMGKKASTEIVKLRSQLVRKANDFKQLYDDTAGQTEKIAHLNAKIEEAARLHSKINILAIDKDRLKGALSRAEITGGEKARTFAADLKRSNGRNYELMQENLDLRNGRDQQKKRIVQLVEAASLLDTKDKTWRNPTWSKASADDNRKLLERNVRLTMEIADAHRENDKLKDEAVELVDASAMQSRIKDLKQQAERLRDIKDKQRREINILYEQRDKQRGALLELQAEYNSIVLQHAAQVDSIVGLQKHSAKLQSEVDTVTARNNAQTKIIEKLGDTRGLKSANDQLREINVTQAEAHQIVYQECVDLKRKNSTQYVTISKFMDRENALKRQNETLREVKDEQAALYTDDLAKHAQKAATKNDIIATLREDAGDQAKIISKQDHTLLWNETDRRRAVKDAVVSLQEANARQAVIIRSQDEVLARKEISTVMKPISVKDAKEFIAVTSLKNVYRDRSRKYNEANEKLRTAGRMQVKANQEMLRREKIQIATILRSSRALRAAERELVVVKTRLRETSEELNIRTAAMAHDGPDLHRMEGTYPVHPMVTNVDWGLGDEDDE